jgi:hypothetical protein
MDVLACLSCGRRYAVRGEGALGGQRCTHCNGELEVVPRDVSRVSLLRRRRPSPGRSLTAKCDIHSASDVDAEIAVLARLARQAERA